MPHLKCCSKCSISPNFWLSLYIQGTSTIVLYGPLNSLSPSTRKGLSNRTSKDKLFLNRGLHISLWSCGENALVDDKDELGDERPFCVKGGSASLQYIVDMHLIMSSESLLGVSRIWSEMRVPRCSAKLITFDEVFWAYWKNKYKSYQMRFPNSHT